MVDQLVGFAGVEIHGEDALLRSVVVIVIAARRRSGWGRKLVETVLDEAKPLGATKAFLLTASASGHFETLGFAVVDRAAAPRAILAAKQAADLCPASAQFMSKTLA